MTAIHAHPSEWAWGLDPYEWWHVTKRRKSIHLWMVNRVRWAHAMWLHACTCWTYTLQRECHFKFPSLQIAQSRLKNMKPTLPYQTTYLHKCTVRHHSYWNRSLEQRNLPKFDIISYLGHIQRIPQRCNHSCCYHINFHTQILTFVSEDNNVAVI